MDYLKKNNCQEYTYSKGSYKAFCDNYFIEIKNSFIVNIDENSKIFKYKDINNLEILPKSSYGVYGSQTSENSIQIRIILQEDDDYTIYLDIDKVNGVTVG